MTKPTSTTAVEHIGYSFVPNHRLTMEALARSRLSAREFRCVILIMNQTDGYLRPEDTIKPAFFSGRTGIDKAHLPNVLKRLLDWKVISREKWVFKVNPPSAWHPDAVMPPSELTENGDSPKTVTKVLHRKRRIQLPETVSLITENGEKQIHPKENLKKTSKENPDGLPHGSPQKVTKQGDSRVRSILETLAQELAYPLPTIPRCAAEIKRALVMGYTEEEFLGCWRTMRAFTFWQGKWLPLIKVVENLGEYRAGQLKDSVGPLKSTRSEAPIDRSVYEKPW